MFSESDWQNVAAIGTPSALQRRWQKLCDEFLPVIPENSIWRYSRASTRHDLEQGWKLHLSATILTANRVLAKAAPLLKSQGVLFKAPLSLLELDKINSGLYYGYGQIGKFLTVYSRSDQEAVALAEQLHRLTYKTPAPAVPFDLRLRRGSSIYYRYGAFQPLEIEGSDGTRVPAMRDPKGTLVPDRRDLKMARPDWVADPFDGGQQTDKPIGLISPLGTTIRAFQALSQRGKGGVYKALDLTVNPPRLCLLKEGRRNGETGWDGRDGCWRVRHEEKVLSSLRAAGVEVPDVYSSFNMEGNHYLVSEFIEGETLQALLSRKRRRLSTACVIRYSVQLTALLARVHSAGWAWRDCKPANLMITRGKLRPLDFEGACPLDSNDPVPWGTQAFVPPAWEGRGSPPSKKYDDLYALGVVLYHLLTGQLPNVRIIPPIGKLRRNTPVELCRVVEELVNSDPRRRPDTSAVMERLSAIPGHIPCSTSP
jgi:hypothetical protein